LPPCALRGAPTRAIPLVLAAAIAIVSPLAAQSAAPRAPAASGEEPYLIGTGDVLQIVVWKEPELTRDVTVRLDGRVTLPLLGDVLAAGRSPADLGAELGKQLTRFVDAPVVTVGVAQPNSARVYVLGQVVNSGAYPMTGRMTVLQALALAGGLREFVKPERILVIRQDGQRSPVPVNYKRLESGSDMSQNVVLKAGDTVLVP
jgi:polysaccharide biosynthesis/export protein